MKFNDLNIKELSDKDFSEKTIKQYKTEIPGIILFYAPWCGHCKNFAPIYKDLAYKLHGHMSFYAVNCHNKNSQKIARLCEIEGYPTLKYISTKGKISKEQCKVYADIDSMLQYICKNVNAEICKK